MEEILRLEHIGFSYEEDRVALNDLSVSLYAGEKVVVLGSNGAGKSTFFLCCNGVHKPKQGNLFLRGERITWKRKETLHLRQTIGLVFQDPDSQIIAGTVESEVSFGPMNLRLPVDEVRARVDSAISCMQLEGFRTRAPHYLSGGEKKRVSIADVLAMNPQLLLLDEPASSLDPANTRILEQNLARLSEKGLGIIIATHDVDFAWRWAERVLVFDEGKLVRDGHPEAVFSDERLLERCGLDRPLLFQIGKLYGMDPLPRTMTDIEEGKASARHEGRRPETEEDLE
jgi:cobalt/nickel transport system ATP-binding protein